MKRLLVTLAIIAAGAYAGSTGASAHAFLDHAIPAVGSTLQTAPAEVSIWFTQELEPAFSGIDVTDASGKRVDKNDPHIDPADSTLLHVSLIPLATGTYRVHWHVLSVDTHRTDGTFSFTVGQ